MEWQAVFNMLYLSSALVILSIPTLWPEISRTMEFHFYTFVLIQPIAHISMYGE